MLAVGSTIGRDLPVPGRELDGHPPGDGVPAAGQPGRSRAGRSTNQITAKDKHVVIIGGGDTGADCLGTAIRQGAKSVTQLEILPTPPDDRPANQPWPTYPMIYRVSSAHEEAGERVYSVSTSEFLGDGRQGHVAADVRGEVRRRQADRDRGHRAGDPGRAGPAGHGLHRAGDGHRGRPARASTRTSAATSPGTTTTPPTSRASSSAATPAAASR